METLPPNLVVTYHYITHRLSDGFTAIQPGEFRHQLDALKTRYKIVTADEFVARSGQETGLALVTFDDGLACQFSLALPILSRVGVPAVFYVPMRPYASWGDGWCTQHLLHALADRLGWERLERQLGTQVGSLAIDQKACDELYHYEEPHKRRLKYAVAFGMEPGLARAMLDEVNRRQLSMLEARRWYMTVTQLHELQARGHSLGGHGFTHHPLGRMGNADQTFDLQIAALTMNHHFGCRPRTMAFPFGSHTEYTHTAALQAGYTHCFSVEDRVDARMLTNLLR